MESSVDMKIEKLNDNQIRCTLTRADLADREIKISELVCGTEKAKTLFQDMMQKAHSEFGFEAEDMPLMIEAVPASSDSIVLIKILFYVIFESGNLSFWFYNLSHISKSTKPSVELFVDTCSHCYGEVTAVIVFVGDVVCSDFLNDGIHASVYKLNCDKTVFTLKH